MSHARLRARVELHAARSNLSGAPHGTSILILGAGMAGLVAAYELRRAGYTVKVLEYNQRAGGRSWTLRGGDDYTELGGVQAEVRIRSRPVRQSGSVAHSVSPSRHARLRQALKVPLEPFNEINYNAYLHSSKAFGGKPQRYRHVYADLSRSRRRAAEQGGATRASSMPTSDDRGQGTSCSSRCATWGVLDKDYRYVKSFATSESRGYDIDRGGGLMPRAGAVDTDRASMSCCGRACANYLVQPVRLRSDSVAVPAGRRHGSHREGDLSRGRAAGPIRRQGDVRSTRTSAAST